MKDAKDFLMVQNSDAFFFVVSCLDFCILLQSIIPYRLKSIGINETSSNLSAKNLCRLQRQNAMQVIHKRFNFRDQPAIMIFLLE